MHVGYVAYRLCEFRISRIKTGEGALLFAHRNAVDHEMTRPRSERIRTPS